LDAHSDSPLTPSATNARLRRPGSWDFGVYEESQDVGAILPVC
jgi:hypothetical protein